MRINENKYFSKFRIVVMMHVIVMSTKKNTISIINHFFKIHPVINCKLIKEMRETSSQHINKAKQSLNKNNNI
jgi:hypothetical protein